MLRPAWPWQLASVRHNVQLCSNLHCLEKYLKQWRPWTSLSRLYLCRALLCPRRPHAAALQPLQWRASSWFPAEDCSKLSLLLPIVGTKFAWILCRQRHRHRGEARCLNVIFPSPLPQWGSGPPCCRLWLIWFIFNCSASATCPTLLHTAGTGTGTTRRKWISSSWKVTAAGNKYFLCFVEIKQVLLFFGQHCVFSNLNLAKGA